MPYSTIGREIYPGHEVKLFCMTNVETLDAQSEERYRIVSVKSGSGIFCNGKVSQLFASPTVLCLNDSDYVELKHTEKLKMDVIYFEPTCFERHIPFQSLQAWKESLGDDDWYFRPFFRRCDQYCGVCNAGGLTIRRASQLIEMAGSELKEQRDCNWPCRSRSFFIELLLLVNSIYDEMDRHLNFSFGALSDEVKEVMEWLHIHYVEKIVLETVTTHFHTNKTTLNQKFKAALGMTVSDYLNTIRIHVACSLLRKTLLPIKDIMERAGYKDDAHFLRSFKKRAGCSPSEYRKQYETV